jgi:hypothetical protein
MAEPTDPPAPPSPDQAHPPKRRTRRPPAGAGTPDGGNPAQAAPPDVRPKPGRTTERGASSEATAVPRKRAAPKPATAKQPAPRRAARPKPTAPKRVSPAAEREAAIPTEPQRVDKQATDPNARKRGRWVSAAMVGGTIAASAALLSLRGSRRRGGAHQADGTDSTRSFDASIADEGTIPEEPKP